MKNLYLPIAKSNIDVERRLVKGIAQIEDKPDHQGDVVDFEASKRAFGKWLGNVREMHGKKAVGKCVTWDADPKKKAIAVTIRVSKGAEDTWQKVLDGTLSAFSIGGHELASQRQIDKSSGRVYNRITDYVLTELSLVDSPANPSCVITAIHKSKSGAYATEVLDYIERKPRMAKKAHVALRSIAKTLGDDDTMLVIKKSDIEIKPDGTLLLKKSAIPGVITKDDASDAGMMSDDDMANADDMGGTDWEDHATNAANMHKDMCDAAGIDDHVGHYEDATRGDDDMDDATMDDNGAGNGDDDMQMSRRTGNLRKNRRNGRVRSTNIDARIEKAVGSRLTAFAKTLDDIKASLGTGGATALSARRESGAPIAKTINQVLGTAPVSGGAGAEEGGLAGRYQALEKSHAELNEKAQKLIAKSDMGHKLSPEEDVERVNLGKQMGRIEVELGELRRTAAGV
jgi:hypothetical protein